MQLFDIYISLGLLVLLQGSGSKCLATTCGSTLNPTIRRRGLTPRWAEGLSRFYDSDKVSNRLSVYLEKDISKRTNFNLCKTKIDSGEDSIFFHWFWREPLRMNPLVRTSMGEPPCEKLHGRTPLWDPSWENPLVRTFMGEPPCGRMISYIGENNMSIVRIKYGTSPNPANTFQVFQT